MTAVIRISTRGFIPISTVLPRPLQHLQVPAPSGFPTDFIAQRASIVTRPPQNLQVPGPSGEFTRQLIPGAALLIMRPLQHIQVLARSGERTRPLSPNAPVRQASGSLRTSTRTEIGRAGITQHQVSDHTDAGSVGRINVGRVFALNTRPCPGPRQALHGPDKLRELERHCPILACPREAERRQRRQPRVRHLREQVGRMTW